MPLLRQAALRQAALSDLVWPKLWAMLMSLQRGVDRLFQPQFFMGQQVTKKAVMELGMRMGKADEYAGSPDPKRQLTAYLYNIGSLDKRPSLTACEISTLDLSPNKKNAYASEWSPSQRMKN